MKLKEFLKTLNDLVESNPKLEEFEVVTAKDDEGNGYNRVYFHPSIGNFDEGEFEFVPFGDFEEYGLVTSDANAICIN